MSFKIREPKSLALLVCIAILFLASFKVLFLIGRYLIPIIALVLIISLVNDTKNSIKNEMADKKETQKTNKWRNKK